MAKGATFANDLLKLIFNATAISLIADNAASGALATLFVALHTADPTAAGTQSSNEISYTGYARLSPARTTSGFTAASAGSTSPVAALTFGAMTAGTGGTVTHFSIGTLTSGAGKILYSGTVTPNIVVSNGVTPQLTTASTITEA